MKAITMACTQWANMSKITLTAIKRTDLVEDADYMLQFRAAGIVLL